MSDQRRLRPSVPVSISTRAAAIGTLVVAISGGLAVISAPSEALDGAVQGRVFRDYNLDGTFDILVDNSAPSATATDVGVPGANVRAYDANGAQVGTTAVTTADGIYTVSGTGVNGTDVRIQVTPPGTYVPGPHNLSAGTTVEFVKSGATGVDIALSMPGDYALPTPRLINAQQLAAINNPFGGALVPVLLDPATQPSLVSSDWATRDGSAPTIEATVAQTGSIWGVAQLDGAWAFSAAFYKRHARTGPGGPGQIYLTTLSGGSDAARWRQIPTPGTNPRVGYDVPPAGATDPLTNDGTPDQWFHDAGPVGSEGAVRQAVGNVGLGGLVLAPDERSLFVVNLNTKSMWQVPFTRGPGNIPVPGTPTEIPMPLALPGAAQACPGGTSNVHPFGLGAHDGAVWATLTCTGPALTDLEGYVYRYDVTTGQFATAPAFEMALDGYTRGDNGGAPPGIGDAWQPWDLTDDQHFRFENPFFYSEFAQPLLSDVAFDANGDMSIGIKDRNGDQTGESIGTLVHDANEVAFTGQGASDVVRACLNPPGTLWVLENDGTCGTRVGASSTNNHGPGGGEFYFDNALTHVQVNLGGLLQVPGFGQIVTTAFDPEGTLRANGYRFTDNVDGSAPNTSGRTTLLPANGAQNGGFGKAGGMGDMDALIAQAPIEIGNRVWFDADRDGLQDPGTVEHPVAGVTVHLYRDGVLVPNTLAITDSEGRYFFSNRVGPLSTSSAIYEIPELVPFGNYTVRLDNPMDYTSGPLAGWTLTQQNALSNASDEVDSDGQMDGGIARTASFTTGGPGVNNHTYDFGFNIPAPAPPAGPPGNPGDPGGPDEPGDPDDPGDEDTAGGGLPGTGAAGGALIVLGLTTLLAGIGMRSVRRRKGDHRTR